MTDTKDEAKAPATVTTVDSTGNEFEVEVGVDGKNPVSVNNPPVKSVSAEDADAIREALAKVEERQKKIQSGGSDGPGNEHNKDGIATDVDLRQGGSRPATPADPSVAQPSEKDQTQAEDEAPAKSASKSDWVKYVVDVKKAATQEEAEAQTRDELAAKYGDK